MKRLQSVSSNISRTKKIACTVSAAALMLGVSSAATVGLHFQENYSCRNASFSGYPVTVTAFGVPPNEWENLDEMKNGYGGCPGSLGYTLTEVGIGSTNMGSPTEGNALFNPLPNGASLNVTWFGPTANYAEWGGYAYSPPYYNYDGGFLEASPNTTDMVDYGEAEVYATFLRDGINFGPNSSDGNNDQPGYLVDITGLQSLFPSTPYVVELIASGDSIWSLTNGWIIDVAHSVTNIVSYPAIAHTTDDEGTQYPQGQGGGLSIASAPFTNVDHLQIMSAPPQHGVGGTATGFNNAGTISGFIITDKPVISMRPQSVPLALPGDTVVLGSYAIGVPPLFYQWQLNGQNIPGANVTNYTIASLTAATAGEYTLVVTNAYGTAISVPAGVGEFLTQFPSAATNIVYDSNPANPQHNGLDLGSTWEASNSDGTFTRTGVMSFVAENTNGITVSGNPALATTNGTFTFWIQSTGTDENANGNFGASLICDTSSTSGGNDFIIYQNDGNNAPLTFQAPNVGGTSANAFQCTSNISDGKWHFVAVSYSEAVGDNVSVYVDGALDTAGANGSTWTMPSDPLEIGYTTDSYWRDYNGLLDDVRFYNAILTPSQIQEIFASGNTNNAAALAEDPTGLKLQFNFDAAPCSGLNLTWQDNTAVLQLSTNLLGPWTTLTEATTPYTIVPFGTQQYFRYQYTPTDTNGIPKTWISNPYLM